MSLGQPYFVVLLLLLEVTSTVRCGFLVEAAEHSSDVEKDLQIEVTKKGAGKQVVISQGAKEWFMLIDESETHDHPMTAVEVNAAISVYVNSVKARAQKK